MKIWALVGSFAAACFAAILLIPTPADGFCGFYVDGAGSEMFADATQVALMREDTRTALSMQNRYAGPPEDFALVIPVPVVLEEENVKTLDDEVFERVDVLTSPRLVEYWERDPCAPPRREEEFMIEDGAVPASGEVTIESQFKVGEYEIKVLSTEESTALEDWLVQNEYNIPEGAAPYFEPYIQDGMYFFVAEVDPEEVAFEDGEAVLSPLRFHYDSEEFSLPVRLGMINSRGEQDLIVNILARNQRYEVANYDNVTIPTNLEVREEVADNFNEFYRALFAETVEENPGAAITEYAWRATGCDPCPGPVSQGLNSDDISTLGADVIPEGERLARGNEWVLTRLHMRYGAEELGEDLVFEEADPIVGGREIYEDDELRQGAQTAHSNAFQGRYIIRHQWEGSVKCENPEFGRWGGPNGAEDPQTRQAPGPNTTGEDVFAQDGSIDVDAMLADSSASGEQDEEEQHESSGSGGDSDSDDDHREDEDSQSSPSGSRDSTVDDPVKSGCTGGCVSAPSSGFPAGPLLVLLGAIGLMVRRRRK